MSHSISKEAWDQLAIMEWIIVQHKLAMTLVSPNSTPYFAIPDGDSTQLTRSGTANVALTWNPRTLVTEFLSLTGNGSLTENWSLKPVTNPDRLE